MKNKITYLFTVLAILASLFAAVPASAASQPAADLPAAEQFLNADGSLNLNTGYSGGLDISDYTVTLDPARGPVFNLLTATPNVWNALGTTPLNNSVFAIAFSGTDVYVGGAFTDAGGDANADYIAKWNGSTWSALGTTPLSNRVYAIDISGTNVYVGGDFSNAGGDANANFIAKWNGTTWAALGTTPLNGSVNEIAVGATHVYVSGNFSNAGGDANADYIAKWSGSTWSALGTTPLNSSVYAIAINGTDVYVGGWFTNAGGDANADYIAKWNGSTWSALGTTPLNSLVSEIAISGTDVYVGGDFSNAGGNTNADYIAKWSGSTWSALGTPLLNSLVNEISISGTDVYAGGTFTNAGGNANADYIAKWNGSTWSALGTTPLNGGVTAIAVSGTEVYAGGNFTNAGGDANADYIATFLSAPAPLPAGWVGSVSVTSDQGLVTVGRPHIGSEVASYYGYAIGSTTTFAPMLFKDAFGGSYDAALYIQNLSNSLPASVSIQFINSSGVTDCVLDDTINIRASKGYWLPSITDCNSGSLPAGWVGGVKVASDQPIVAVGRPHIGSEVMTYNSFFAGSTSAFVPMLFKGAFGGSYNAAFYVQNVHASNTANLTIEYFDSAGTLNCTKSDTLAALASKGYWVPTATCDTGSLPAGWVGGVRVTSDQPIVTVGRPHIGSQITTYSGFSTGTNYVNVPMLFKDAFGGSYDSAFYLQNINLSSASVTIKYYDNAGTLNCTKSDTIAPLASTGYWVPSATCDSGSLPTGWVGSVEVTSDRSIVAVGRPHIGTQVTTYNGSSGGATNSYLPMLFKDAFGGSYDAAFYLRNTEASTANVTISFYDANGTLTCTREDTIQPRATLGFWTPDVTCYP